MGILKNVIKNKNTIFTKEQAGNGQISDEDLSNAHSILKKEIVDWANGEMAKCWWPERMKWRSFRKIFERDIEVN